MKKKIIAFAAVVALVAVLAIGGTVAWLQVKTDPLKNTFTYGDVSITLAETTTQYKMVPGNTIAKDPIVTVSDDSEDCWLFVKVEKSTNFDSFMSYTVADGWTELSTGIYYRKVLTADQNRSFSVLANDQVSVKDTVTKADFAALSDATSPTLTFTAYAIQADGFNEVASAWTQVSK